MKYIVSTAARRNDKRRFYKVDWGFFSRRRDWRRLHNTHNKYYLKQNANHRRQHVLGLIKEFADQDFDIPWRHRESPSEVLNGNQRADDEYNSLIVNGKWNRVTNRRLTKSGGPCGFKCTMTKVRYAMLVHDFWEPDLLFPERYPAGPHNVPPGPRA
jgi:hypothetical protein